MTQDISTETGEQSESTQGAQSATAPSSISVNALPPLGTDLLGGLFAGITTRKDGTHAAVILLPNKAQEEMTWKAATAWAAEAGGELPTRPVAAMLFANAKEQFDEEWHWTSEPYGGSYAWVQYFLNGTQGWYDVDGKVCARAVRMIPLVL